MEVDTVSARWNGSQGGRHIPLPLPLPLLPNPRLLYPQLRPPNMMHNPRARLLESVRQRLQGPGVLARHRGHDEPDALLVPRLRAAPLVDLLPERILRCSELVLDRGEEDYHVHGDPDQSVGIWWRGSRGGDEEFLRVFSSPVAGSTIRSVWFRRAAYTSVEMLHKLRLHCEEAVEVQIEQSVNVRTFFLRLGSAASMQESRLPLSLADTLIKRLKRVSVGYLVLEECAGKKLLQAIVEPDPSGKKPLLYKHVLHVQEKGRFRHLVPHQHRETLDQNDAFDQSGSTEQRRIFPQPIRILTKSNLISPNRVRARTCLVEPRCSVASFSSICSKVNVAARKEMSRRSLHYVAPKWLHSPAS
ncbi:hypothetical protein KC359_g226 [Hortaea werneckii]|nr:hypothetical protein KC359_g226 [Hortaea werneckii]